MSNHIVNESRNVPGKRDGTGPYKGSYMRRKFGKGRRRMLGQSCPVDIDDEVKLEDEDVAETKMTEVGKEKVHTQRFDRCVKKVKAKSGKKVNPYAVCMASIGPEKAIKKSHRRSEALDPMVDDVLNGTEVSEVVDKLMELKQDEI